MSYLTRPTPGRCLSGVYNLFSKAKSGCWIREFSSVAASPPKMYVFSVPAALRIESGVLSYLTFPTPGRCLSGVYKLVSKANANCWIREYSRVTAYPLKMGVFAGPAASRDDSGVLSYLTFPTRGRCLSGVYKLVSKANEIGRAHV